MRGPSAGTGACNSDVLVGACSSVAVRPTVPDTHHNRSPPHQKEESMREGEYCRRELVLPARPRSYA